MALSITSANAIINDIVTEFDRLYVVNDPSNLITLGSSIGSHTSRVLDTYRVPIWNAATNGNQITMGNDTTSNPLYYLIEGGNSITHYVLTNSSGVVSAIITPSSAISFSVDNAHYVRAFGLVFTNV